MKHQFIAIEGPDASGKKTQAELLAKALVAKGLEVTSFDFPQYQKTWGGDKTRRYLKGEFGESAQIHPYLVGPLFAIDRFEAAPLIREAFSRREIVIANRYVGSNLAHQSGKLKGKEKEAFIRAMLQLEYRIFKIPRESITLFLDVSIETIQTLIEKRGSEQDGHEANLEHEKAALAAYHLLARTLSWWRRIECEKKGKLLSPEAIHQKICQALDI